MFLHLCGISVLLNVGLLFLIKVCGGFIQNHDNETFTSETEGIVCIPYSVYLARLLE